MTSRNLLYARLHCQNLDEPRFETPADMVRYFGAVQAQDFLGSLWAIGQRVDGSTEAAVEAELNEGRIVRSWPMRGTIHFTAPEDLRWMLDLLGPRAIAKSATNQRNSGLTKRDFVKSRKIFEKELQGRKAFDRNEIYELLERQGIDTKNTRGLHIIGQMAREKVICFGPRRGKQPTFVLLDEWIPGTKKLSQEEALAELTSRYFKSHGPATVHDFAWWSGLTVTTAARGVEMVRSQLQQVEEFWMAPGNTPDLSKLNVRLLPAFDEFLVGYHDRSASEVKAIKKLKDINSIFTSTIIVNGHITGIWKRTITGKGVGIRIKAFEKISKQTDAGIKREMKRFAAFIGMKLTT